ncbi:uncharacterized protein LOC114350398 [Ostrinia furnacalis]|uniref:uncharacterized protein LOC114350398 n=1 Tax=Ostrinia furnacalis TaxID=93504 RepID=UPI00103DF7C9|nr:uncharacterized protein LOC114350398 [Ostrinia furnacalis]
MAETSNHGNDHKSNNNFKDESEIKYMDGQSYRTHCGLCCVCHTFPTNSRTYYGHVFCIDCFHKYIWTPSKRECSGDALKKRSGEPSVIQNSAK